MTSCEVHVTERNASVEGGHDERRSEHVRMHGTQPGTLADRTNPSVRGASIEPLFVAATQDGPLAAFAHGQVDRASSPWDQRDRRWLVALPEDPQCPMASFEAEVLFMGEPDNPAGATGGR